MKLTVEASILRGAPSSPNIVLAGPDTNSKRILDFTLMALSASKSGSYQAIGLSSSSGNTHFSPPRATQMQLPCPKRFLRHGRDRFPSRKKLIRLAKRKRGRWPQLGNGLLCSHDIRSRHNVECSVSRVIEVYRPKKVSVVCHHRSLNISTQDQKLLRSLELVDMLYGALHTVPDSCHLETE